MKKLTKFAVVSFALAALFVAGSAKAYTHTVTLKMGSKGSQVMELQKALNGNGFSVSVTGPGSSGMESTSFGAKGLGADGVVGAKTGAALSGLTGTGSGGTTTGSLCPNGMTLASNCTMAPGSTTGGTTTVSGLTGGASSMTDVNELSTYNGEKIGEGDTDHKVMSFEVKADNAGDIAVSSMKLTLTDGANGGSNHLDRYVTGFSVWNGSTKVGMASTSDFNKDSSGVYSKTITLSTPIVVKANQRVTIDVAANAVSNLDSNDAGENWTVKASNFRYSDATGAILSEGTLYSDKVFSVESLQSATTVEAKLSQASDSPVAQEVKVSETTSTKDVVLLSGSIKAQGSDMYLNNLPVRLDITGDSDGIAEIANTLKLKINGQTYSKSLVSAATSATITLDDNGDDLNLKIPADSSVSFQILADINEIGAGTGGSAAFDQGDTLTAQIDNGSQWTLAGIEDKNGDTITSRTGSAVGKTQTFRSKAISLSLVSVSSDVQAGSGAGDDFGTFKIKFSVKANGSDVYISSVAGTAVSVVSETTTTSVTGSSSIADVTDNVKSTAGNYLITDGSTETFEITTTIASIGAFQYETYLSSLAWDTSDVNAANTYTYTSNLDGFKTGFVGMN